MKSGTPRPHLFASLIASAVACTAIMFGYGWCREIEHEHIADLASDLSDPKLQGVAIQREAFTQPELFVLYGSSELMKEVPLRAAEFFHDYPTGFRVFPVGKAGTTSLPILQKLAGVGESLRGRKVALSLSPSFFFGIFDKEEADPEWWKRDFYIGNFSPLHAYELIFSDELSFDLKRAAARRMLAYPETLDDQWLLNAVLHRLVRGTVLDRTLYYAAYPLGKLQIQIAELQDHFEAALHIQSLPPTPEHPKQPRRLDWAGYLQKAEALARQSAATAKAAPPATNRPKGSRDPQFLARLGKFSEWEDLELTLTALRELGAQPLVLSMPVHGMYFDSVGISPKARAAFPKKLQQLTSKYDVPLVYFRSKEDDPFFFADYFAPVDHLGAEGWVYYNKALDDFYHGRKLTE